MHGGDPRKRRAVLLEMSPEACQDLSWHRAVAETDETPFWPACSQSDGPAQGRERTIGRKAGRCY